MATDIKGFCVITDRYRALADESREACMHPGKFEGCAPYVSYFWSLYLEGCADRDDGKVLGFDITNEDKALFPELKGRRTVRLYETDAGFVVEA